MRAHADLDQATSLKHPQGLANSDAAHTEPGAKFAFAGQAVAGLEPALVDEHKDLVEDHFADPAVADRAEQLRFGRRHSVPGLLIDGHGLIFPHLTTRATPTGGAMSVDIIRPNRKYGHTNSSKYLRGTH